MGLFSCPVVLGSKSFADLLLSVAERHAFTAWEQAPIGALQPMPPMVQDQNEGPAGGQSGNGSGCSKRRKRHCPSVP
jgi:hypothetical protein